MEAQAKGSRVVSGHPIGIGGRSRPSYFPPFPQVCPATRCMLIFSLLKQGNIRVAQITQFGILLVSQVVFIQAHTFIPCSAQTRAQSSTC